MTTEGTPGLRDEASKSGRPRYVAVILTAIDIEMTCVLRRIVNATSQHRVGGTRYEIGAFSGDHIDWTVAVAEIGEGNLGAAVKATAAIRENPTELDHVRWGGGRPQSRLAPWQCRGRNEGLQLSRGEGGVRLPFAAALDFHGSLPRTNCTGREAYRVGAGTRDRLLPLSRSPLANRCSFHASRRSFNCCLSATTMQRLSTWRVPACIWPRSALTAYPRSLFVGSPT